MPELDLRLRRPPPLDRDPHQVADALDVDHLERVPLEHAVLEVPRQELPLRVVARERERRLRQVVRAEREEVRDLGDLVGTETGPRHLDHRADEVLQARRLLLPDRLGQVAQPRELLAEADERVHHLDDRRSPGALEHGAGARAIARICIS